MHAPALIMTAIVLSASLASALEPAPLVLPPAGTKLHYDEGGTYLVYTVVESKLGAYSLVRDDGKGASTSAGGIVSPALRYRDERGYEGQQNVTKGDPASIYPLQVGRSTQFTVSGEVMRQRRVTWIQDYRCSVTGTEKIKIRLGDIDTFVVHCERFGPTGAKDQEVTRNYAPSVGVTVRAIVVDHTNNNRWTNELVRIERP